MKQLLDYNTTLRDFSYKPNFRYGAYEREKGEWWIRIVMFVEDSRQPMQRWDPRPHPSSREMYFDIDYNRYSAPEFYAPERPVIEVVGNYPIPYFIAGDDTVFIKWMVDVLKTMELHELDEWARYKGELLNDPHAT